MNRKGFTLIELLATLALLGGILCMGIFLARDTLSTSLLQIRKVSDNEVFEATRGYVLEENVKFNRAGYTCVLVKDLVDMGYLENTNDEDLKKRKVMVVRDIDTKVIKSIEFDDDCE